MPDILYNDGPTVKECLLRQFERDTMLEPILDVLSLVPFKAAMRHIFIIFMYC
jgi:hypothetical protein